MSMLVDQEARGRIVTAHDDTLFVDAGAGTGKTKQLVDRVVALITGGRLASIAAVAAITFTENAATELRTRIREALEDATDPTGGRPPRERERAALALTELDDAAITTLHGFAARLLGDAPLEAGLPPGFTVQDAIEASLDRDRWWRAQLDEWFADPALTEVWRVGLTLGLKSDDLSRILDAFDANWDLLLDQPFPAATLPVISTDRLLAPLRTAAGFAGHGPDGDRMTIQLNDLLAPAAREAETETDPLQLLALLADLPISPGAGSAAAWRAKGADLAAVRAACQELVDRRHAMIDACGTAVATTLLERLRRAVLDHATERRRVGRLWFHDLLVLSVHLLRTNTVARAATGPGGR